MIKDRSLSGFAVEQLEDVTRYSLGITHGGLTRGPENYVSPWDFKFSIDEWLVEEHLEFSDKHFVGKHRLRFSRPPESTERFSNELATYGTTPQGRAQAIKRVQVANLWRVAERVT